MNRFFFLTIVMMLLVAGYSMAQQESPDIPISDEKIILNGQKFYLHKVKQGQTIYSICNAYNVEEKELLVHNPELSRGLKAGATIKIPVRPLKSAEEMHPEIDTSDYHVIKIRRKHTLYSLSKRYDVTIQEIYEANPGLETRGLKINDTIIIPKHALQQEKVDFTDPEFSRDTSEYVYHTVKQGETLYRIGKKYNVKLKHITGANPDLKNRDIWVGEVIKIPREKIRYVATFPKLNDSVQAHVRLDTSSVYDTIRPDSLVLDDSLLHVIDTLKPSRIEEMNVLLMLPFNAEANIEHIKDKEKDDKQPALYPYTESMVRMYEGVLLGLEHLDSLGGKINLNVRDTRGSIEETKTILNNLDTLPDVIIGPIGRENIELTLNFADTNDVNVITMVDPENHAMFKHRSLISIQPNMQIQWFFIAEYLIEHNYPVVIVHDGTQSTVAYADEIKFFIIDYFAAHGEPDYDNIATIAYNREQKGAVKNALSPEDTTFVISALSDKIFVTGLINTMYQCKEKEVILLGNEQWLGQNYVEMEAYKKLRFSYVSPVYINYADSSNYRMIQQFREYFMDEPDKYAFMGYDATMIFPLTMEYGDQLKPALESEGKIVGRCMNLTFTYKGENIPLVNTALKLIRLQEDYRFTVEYEN
ncbi:MAG: amino acid ABC transporter substrate-binding protein [Bacteroidales bacterium]